MDGKQKNTILPRWVKIVSFVVLLASIHPTIYLVSRINNPLPPPGSVSEFSGEKVIEAKITHFTSSGQSERAGIKIDPLGPYKVVYVESSELSAWVYSYGSKKNLGVGIGDIVEIGIDNAGNELRPILIHPNQPKLYQKNADRALMTVVIVESVIFVLFFVIFLIGRFSR